MFEQSLVIHIHTDLTESTNHLQITNDFASANDDRIRHFGRFWNNFVAMGLINVGCFW